MLIHRRAPASPDRVVVLGGSGFIGSHLTAALNAAGMRCLPLSSRDVNLAAPDSARRLAEIAGPRDTIVLLSCLTPERMDERAAFARNLVMGEQVGAFMEKNGCAHVIYVSSDAVYGEAAVLRENLALAPADAYGQAHAAREAILSEAAAARGVPLAVLRPCAIYGSGDTHDAYGPNRFLRTALRSGRIELFGEGEDERDHLLVTDLAAVIAQCAARLSQGVANVATGTAHSFRQVALGVARAAGVPVEIVSVARRGPVSRRRVDTSVLASAFPALTPVPLDRGLARLAHPSTVA